MELLKFFYNSITILFSISNSYYYSILITNKTAIFNTLGWSKTHYGLSEGGCPHKTTVIDKQVSKSCLTTACCPEVIYVLKIKMSLQFLLDIGKVT